MRHRGASQIEDDLFQAGCEALLKAARRYNPDTGVEFSAYVQKRIIGSCQDYLRERDPITRQERMNAAHGRKELPQRQIIQGEIAEKVLGVLGTPPTQEKAAALAQARGKIAAALESIPDNRRRLAFALYWGDELNLAEVAAVMGYSESRACQVIREVSAELMYRLDGQLDGSPADWPDP